MIKKRNCKSSFDKIFCFKKCKSKFFSNLDAHQEKIMSLWSTENALFRVWYCLFL